MPAPLRSYFRSYFLMCLPKCVFVLDGMTASSRSRLPLSRIVSQCVPVLDSDNVSAFQRSYHIPRLPLSPHMCACVGWCVHLPKVLSPLVSPCLPLSPIISHCLPKCVPVLGGLPAWVLPSPCLPLSPFLFLRVGLCVRLPEALFPVSHSLSLSFSPSLIVFRFVSQFVSQLVSLLVSLCGEWSYFAFFRKQFIVRGS